MHNEWAPSQPAYIAIQTDLEESGRSRCKATVKNCDYYDGRLRGIEIMTLKAGHLRT